MRLFCEGNVCLGLAGLFVREIEEKNKFVHMFAPAQFLLRIRNTHLSSQYRDVISSSASQHTKKIKLHVAAQYTMHVLFLPT